MEITPDQTTRDFKFFEELKGLRVNWDWLWQRIADFVIPTKADFVITRFQGQRRDQQIFDTTAPWALSQLAAGLHTLLTSQALPWFYLTIRDRSLLGRQDVGIWLEDIRSRINAVFNDPASRFQSQLHEVYNDLGAFGTAVLDVQYDKGIRFTNRYLGECFMSETHYGMVDTMFRGFGLPYYRIVDLFGEKAIDEKTRKAGEKDVFHLFPLLHAVTPNPDSGFGSRYYLFDTRKLLRSGSFKAFPYITPRWKKSSIEHYGRSPAMECLGDILMINDMQKSYLRAAHKALSPPLMVPDGGYLQSINLKPDSTIYYDATMPGEVKYLESRGEFPVGEKIMEMKQQAIVRAFYVDMLQLPGGLMPGAKNQNTYMTATEAMIRRENSMRTIGPIISRLQTELLSPLISRVFELMRRQRSIPPAPSQIVGHDLDLTYVSPLSIAQSGAEVDNFTRFFTQIQPIAALDQTILDSVNLPEVPVYLARKYHIPMTLMRTQEQVQAVQQQRAQAQQAQVDEIQANKNLTDARRNTEYSKQMLAYAGQNRAT